MAASLATSLRGIAAAQEKNRRTGMVGGNPLWSEEEIDVLKWAWPDFALARRLLPHRSLPAIEHKGAKLNLRRKKRNHMWSGPDVTKLIRLWPTATRADLLEAFPWAIWDDLANQMQHQKRIGRTTAARPKPEFTLTGHQATDAVLIEARRSNLTLRDVDMIAGTRRYFSSGRHRRGVQWRYLGKTIEALGGEVIVDWDGEP